MVMTSSLNFTLSAQDLSPLFAYRTVVASSIPLYTIDDKIVVS